MTLARLVAETLGLPEGAAVRDHDGPGSVDGWDSLAHVRLLAAVEREYGVTVPRDRFAAVEDVAGLRELLRELGARGT